MQCYATYQRARLSLALASALGVGLMIVSTEPVGVDGFEHFTPQNAKRDAFSSVAQFSSMTQKDQRAAD